MRMWMIEPKKMCNKHLLGEHVELHMFVGSINKNISLKGYVNNNLVEPLNIVGRHTDLVVEMEKRGMKHKSNLPKFNVLIYEPYIRYNKVDVEKSYFELINRCNECKKRCDI